MAQARPAPLAPSDFQEKLLDRFLRYVRINTQSRSGAAQTPSTPGQWTLLRLLRDELRKMGAKEIHLSPQGHLMATIPATVPTPRLPCVAFLAHVDTAPDFSAEEVKPIVHRRYDGRRLILPDDPTQILDPAGDPDLRSAVGKDLITASGRTLLGADDKSGVAVIMTLADQLLRHPEIPHGRIRVCFLPDEEVGLCGAANLDLARLGAQVGYTLDGGGNGQVVGESFSGDAATVTVRGVATHPGTARANGLLNAVHLASKLVAALPREFVSPETTEHYQGYLHPVGLHGNAAEVRIDFILRDFTDAGLADKRRRLLGLCRGIAATEPRARIDCQFTPSYRNMAKALRGDTRPVALAIAATRRAGGQPQSPPIRGGTDGTQLSGRGLPTPNLSSGQHNVHGPLEWVTAQDMALAVRVCQELVQLWAQKGQGYRL